MIKIGILVKKTAITYGSDFCTGGTASADTVYGGTTYPAANGFDNNAATFWASAINPTFPHWIKYDLGSGVTKVAAQYKLTARDTTYNDSSAFKLQGSNDNSTWDDIDSQTGITWSNGETKIFNSFTNSTAYRYYRIYFITSGRSSTIAEIAEVEIMEGS